MTRTCTYDNPTATPDAQAERLNPQIVLPGNAAPQQCMSEDEYIDPENGLIYCAKCHTPRQGRYHFQLIGRDMTPRFLCKCQSEERKAAEEKRLRQERMAKVSRLRASGLQNRFLHDCRFEKDTMHCPELAKAHAYVENWDSLKKKGQGLLLWDLSVQVKHFSQGALQTL